MADHDVPSRNTHRFRRSSRAQSSVDPLAEFMLKDVHKMFYSRYSRHLLRICVLFALQILAGCKHIHENSADANVDQIRAHLKGQLHCQSLELDPTDKNKFAGSGKMDGGDFTIDATREGQSILFQGEYVEPARGKFSGSASWSKELNAFIGFHRSRVTVQDSTSSQP
jgi:hypothetical protein